jgi:hypothetical protein
MSNEVSGAPAGSYPVLVHMFVKNILRPVFLTPAVLRTLTDFIKMVILLLSCDRILTRNRYSSNVKVNQDHVLEEQEKIVWDNQ